MMTAIQARVLRSYKARGKPFSEAMRALAYTGHPATEAAAQRVWLALPLATSYSKLRRAA